MKRLGGDVVNLGDVSTSSVVKGETLFDTIQMVDGYTDIIAMRHPRQGAGARPGRGPCRSSTRRRGRPSPHPNHARSLHHPPAHGRLESLDVVPG